jgi:predicted dehydrogenase
MADKIRLGFVGANINSRWSSESHYPALAASADVELTAVCTTRTETAEAARQFLGAKLAFTDYNEMIASPEIDAVAVIVRVPWHEGPTRAAIEAGKHVYTEWPLSPTTAEAESLAALAKQRGVMTAIGLQSRVSPVLLFAKELVETGYVGKLLTCLVTVTRNSPSRRASTWQRDARHGSNSLTITGGHNIDALQFVAGDFARLSAQLSTQVKQWFDTTTNQLVDVTSPDDIILAGTLQNGAAASVHITQPPYASNGCSIQICGAEGVLLITGEISSQRGPALRLQGAQHGAALAVLDIPEKFSVVGKDFPKGDPYNVGQMYALFAQAIRTGKAPAQLPTFDNAVTLHRLIDKIREASDTGQAVAIS